MLGIDVSSFQSELDWSKVKADIAIIKVCQDVTYINPYFKAQYAKAKSLNLKVGFYTFIGTSDGTLQAEFFLKQIEGLTSDTLYIADAEIEPDGISSRIRAFADKLISVGKKPCLYSGLDFYNEQILPICHDIPLWVAKYGTSIRPQISSCGWQYTNKGIVGGSLVDMSIFDDEILLSKVEPVVTIKSTPVIVVENTKVKTLQELCNTLSIKGSNGESLLIDGICGTNSTFAIEQLPLCGIPYVQPIATKVVQKFIGALQDGIFGEKTAVLLELYQKSKKLIEDGICGKNTFLSFTK